MDRNPGSASGLKGDRCAGPGDHWDRGATVVGDGKLDAEDPALHPILRVVEGTSNQRELRLGAEPVTIGRSTGNDLVLSDELISRSHARVVFEDGLWVVEDAGSANGLWVNNQQVTRVVLRPDVQLKLGSCVLGFEHVLADIPRDHKLALIDRCKLLAPLDATSKGVLADGMAIRFVPRGGVVLEHGDLVDSLLFIVKGAVRLAEVNEEGGERHVDMLVPGDVFGERALVGEPKATVTLVAHGDVLMLELGTTAVARLMQQKPKASDTMYGAVRDQLRSAQGEEAPRSARRDALAHLVVSTDVAIVGEDKKLLRAKEKAEALAKEDSTVLIAGPQGSGKRTLARHYHRSGPRSNQPYIEVSLTELDTDKIAPALFGVEADVTASGGKGQVGFLEMMGEGTLAIVHAELLDVHLQSLLLTYLKRGFFHRVWGQQAVRSEVRLVFVAKGSEQELKDRLLPELGALLQDRTVTLPSLTQRLKDIPLLAEHYLKKNVSKAATQPLVLSREATEKLVSYGWPGNVEELVNVMARASIVSSEQAIIPADLIFVAPPEKEVHKINVLRDDGARRLFRDPRLFAVPMWINLAFVIVVGLLTAYGATRPDGHPLAASETNPGMLVTWLVWFPLLPLSAALAGRVWCGTCPIAGFGDLVARLGKLDLPVPKIFKRLEFWMLIASYILVEFLEGVFDVEGSPRGTAIFLVAILAAAAVFTVLFERRAFCRYLCPLAAWLGGYSTLSPVEVRGNKKICQTQCGEHTCYKGTDTVPGCPMFLYPASMSSNAECLMCANCVRSCDNRGVQINLRPPLQELWRNHQPIFALSAFALILLGVMMRHHFTGTTWWKGFKTTLTISPDIAKLILLALFAGGAILALALASTLSAAASQEKLRSNMARYGIGFMPLAFAGHAAALVDEVFGKGMNEMLSYLGQVRDAVFKGVPITVSVEEVSTFLHPAVITFIELMVLVGGAAASAVVMIMIARRAGHHTVIARALPHLLLVGVFAVLLIILLFSVPQA